MMAGSANFRGVIGRLLLQVLVVTLIASTGGVLSLKLVRVSVPQYKVRGDMALLECQYDLGGVNKLYSVKWYKDNEEFYRYIPSSETIKQSFKVEGVRVEHHLSNDKQVALKSVNLKSTGYYRCEVSAERPTFTSAEGGGRMEVVYLPKDGPHITGEEEQYQVGEEISLNCTSGKSYPASELQWFINDEQVTSLDALVHYPDVVHPHGLLVSTLGLSFTVTSSHFLNGSMKVRCVASVSPILWRGDRESVVQRVSPAIEKNIREALILLKGASNQCGAYSASVIFVAVMTSFLLSTVT